jgi:F-type H+-transporting ATPase subunit epsilon
MASQLTLSIVTPERELVRVEADEVELPGTEGYFGVLPGHTPLLAALKVGRLTYRVGQERHVLAIATGLAEVLPDRVTVLSQIAELPEDIDVGRAEEARKRAEDLLTTLPENLDYARARNALDKAVLRLQVASRARAR